MFLGDNLVLVERVELPTIPPVRYLTEQSPSVGVAAIQSQPQSLSVPKAALPKSHVAALLLRLIATEIMSNSNLFVSTSWFVERTLYEATYSVRSRQRRAKRRSWS